MIDVQLQPLTLTTTDRERARRLMPFLIDDAAPSDGIPDTDRAAWFAGLERLERGGRGNTRLGSAPISLHTGLPATASAALHPSGHSQPGSR